MCSTRSCLPRRMHLQWISCALPAAPRAAPIPPRCCRPMPFWGTMPELTRYRPPWPCCPCLGQSRLRSRCAQLALGRTARALCWHRPPLPRSTCRCGAFWPWRWGWPKRRCASYHIWATLPLTPTPDGEELCAQYLASGLTLRAVVPLDSQQLLVFAAHTPVGRGSTVRRVHLQDPALPRLLERGGAVADFGWDKQGLVLSVRRME